MKRSLAILLLTACTASSPDPPPGPSPDLPPDLASPAPPDLLPREDLPITVPPGFYIHTYAMAPGARSMALGQKGTLFVGSKLEGKIYAVLDRDRDGRGEEVLTLAGSLLLPNGVAFRNGALYVAELGRVLRYDDIENHLDNPPDPVVLPVSYPVEFDHGWKFIAFGPDDKLYVPQGVPCNICKPTGLYGTITRIAADGSGREIFAQGVRNSVGFDFHPRTGQLWFTDNGMDGLGDDLPGDELNRAARPGQHFGFPFCHGGDLPDEDYGGERSCDTLEPPAQKLGAHVAALGMRFYTGTLFPKEYQGHIFIAEHGSWNRTVPVGYRVTLVRLSGDQPASYTAFAEGQVRGDDAFWRPVDVLVMPDGALLVSEDKQGRILRIGYNAPR